MSISLCLITFYSAFPHYFLQRLALPDRTKKSERRALSRWMKSGGLSSVLEECAREESELEL